MLTYDELAFLRDYSDFGKMELVRVMYRIINAIGDEDNSVKFSSMIVNTLNSCEDGDEDDKGSNDKK